MGRNFVIVFVALMMGAFLPVMGVNIYVDPLMLFSDTQPEDVFKEKPFQTIPEHLTLPIIIRNRDNIGTLIVGSSTSRYMLETPERRIRNSKNAHLLFDHQPVFDAALGGATVHMVLDVIKHALAFHDIKEIVYVINFDGLSKNRSVSENYDSKNFDGLRGMRSYARILPFLWSSDTILDSLHTIELNLSSISNQTGVDKISTRQRWIRNTSDYLYVGLYKDFEMTANDIKALNDIIEISKNNEIKLSFIASPIHPVQMEIVHQSGAFYKYARHLKIITNMCEKNDIPFLAFNIYVPPFSESFFDVGDKDLSPDAPDFNDGVHFNSVIGVELLKYLKNSESKYGNEIGIHLNKQNVDDYIHTLKYGMQHYLEENPDVRSLISDIKNYNPRVNYTNSPKP